MKKALLILQFCSLVFCVMAQKVEKPTIAKNNLYLAIGDFSLLGFNYERILKIRTKSLFGIKAGLAVSIVPNQLGYLPTEILWGFGYNFGVFYLFPHRNHKNHWEIGLHNSTLIHKDVGGWVSYGQNNGVPFQIDSSYHFRAISGSIGPRVSFRHQRPQGGFFYKIGLTLCNINYSREFDRPQKALYSPKYYFHKFPVPELAFGWTF